MSKDFDKYIKENPTKKFVFISNDYIIDSNLLSSLFKKDSVIFIVQDNKTYYTETSNLNSLNGFTVKKFNGDFNDFISTFSNYNNFFTQNDFTNSLHSNKIANILKKSKYKDLPYSFSINGYVQHGAQIARQMNFPTANLITPYKSYIENGVYFTKVNYNNETYTGITCVRHQGIYKIVETHILDFKKDIYDDRLKVKFINKIRDNKKCKSLDEVRELINNDIKQIRKLEKKYGN